MWYFITKLAVHLTSFLDFIFLAMLQLFYPPHFCSCGQGLLFFSSPHCPFIPPLSPPSLDRPSRVLSLLPPRYQPLSFYPSTVSFASSLHILPHSTLPTLSLSVSPTHTHCHAPTHTLHLPLSLCLPSSFPLRIPLHTPHSICNAAYTAGQGLACRRSTYHLSPRSHLTGHSL